MSENTGNVGPEDNASTPVYTTETQTDAANDAQKSDPVAPSPGDAGFTPEPEPSAYDRKQDQAAQDERKQQEQELSDRDAEIAALKEKLAAFESNQPAVVTEETAQVPAPIDSPDQPVVNRLGHLQIPQPEEAGFQEPTEPRDDDAVASGGADVGAGPDAVVSALSTDAHVQLPEYDAPEKVEKSDVRDVKESLARVETKVNELYADIQFVKKLLPQLGEAVSKSPLASFLPKFDI